LHRSNVFLKWACHVRAPVKDRPGLVVAAFAAVYLIWGSTYLGIKLAIETIPPLLMGGIRFIVAGVLLWLLLPGDRRVRATASDWKWAFLLSGLMLLIGNGIVNVVETKMPTGIAALLITSVPLWMVMWEWILNRQPPTWLIVLGLVVGFTGVGILVTSSGGWVGGEVDPLFVGAILFGSSCWALGSVLSRRGGIRLPILRSVALQMFAGGILLTVAGTLKGEWTGFAVSDVTLESFLAWLYLIGFGSLVAFTAYVWLLSVRPSALVSTYAFVNPVVAVVLGALWLGEPLTARVAIGTVLVVGAVALVTYEKARSVQRAAQPAAPAK
jgi:drug/metabolite transporter (DMT)-like permease